MTSVFGQSFPSTVILGSVILGSGGNGQGKTGQDCVPFSTSISIPSSTRVLGVAGGGGSETRRERCRHYGKVVLDGRMIPHKTADSKIVRRETCCGVVVR
jgi:hypothetical protein